jgi:arsenate reductase (glutaredoxin)
MTSPTEVVVYFNPACSKCQGVREILASRGVEPAYVHHLDDPPGRTALERIMDLLGVDDPRAMMRTGEPMYGELNLAGAEKDELFDAMVRRHPILVERPMVIRGDRATVARPPQRLLELL